MIRLMDAMSRGLERMLGRFGLGMRAKLISIFLLVNVIPLVLLTLIAWQQFVHLGDTLRDIAVNDSKVALNDSAVENIERMSTDTARRVASFLYSRDDDLTFLSKIEPDEETYRAFVEDKTGRLVKPAQWVLSEDQSEWVPTEIRTPVQTTGGISTNPENNDMDGFHYRPNESFEYENVPLYDEIAFIDLDGNEIVKYVTPNSTKVNYPFSREKTNVSARENTYVKAENYFEALASMKPGEIYVSDVIGAYVGTNYIGMYAPPVVQAAAETRGYDIPYEPETQAYAGMENPNGQRFEGIVRWATPVAGPDGEKIGYVTFALNHDHIMEFVDHQTPMNDRYTELPSAFEGNYAFIWDYNCRNICHPRHHSIIGYDPETGEPQVPWLESSIYDAWQASGETKWTDFVSDLTPFDEQSRQKKPAPALTQAGLVGLDGRYLNNAPQCTGWMDLTQDGGSGSFYILWSGLYKLNTAAAIPYYTGQYAPSEQNNFSRRGFGFVAIGAGMDDFTRPAQETEIKLVDAARDTSLNTSLQLIITTAVIIILVVLIAILLASYLTNNITQLIKGISRFRTGERQFRFHAKSKDEFGTLADSFDEMADSVVNSVSDPLCITDMDQSIIYMNDAGLKLCSTTLEKAVNTHYGDVSVYPEHSVYCPIMALIEGREAEILYLKSTKRYIRGKASYYLSKDGEKIGYTIISRDVTEMVRERMKIEEQRTLLDMIFSASPDLIWYQDMEGRYITVNPRFASITGCSVDEFAGETAETMLPPGLAETFHVNDRSAIAARTPQYSEERVVFADGHEEMLDSVRTPIYDASGTLAGLLGFARDVSARVTIEHALRTTQNELEQAVEDANKANEHKGEFLARMSHEIRTPMNAIIGITNIVQRKLMEIHECSGDMDEIRGHVNQIEASSQHLLGLLNDILDISKIEAGKIELTEETVELAKLAETVAGIIRPRCDEKNITFVTAFDIPSPSTFICDSLRLRQVLINLLGNAVKFTPELGRITFEIRKRGEREGESCIEFRVRDTGIGISDDAQEAIFKPFEQAGSMITRKYGGTGLGLAISRRIVQLLGGDIELKSEVGEGSDFSFELWLKEAERDASAEGTITDATGKFKGKRALLVDDVEINRMIVMSMLEMTGMNIDEADDGQVALEMFKASPVGTYDIIFMDVLMPNMDGHEATKAIRALDRFDASTVPIVALTANAFKEDMDKAVRCGMNVHISKPVEMDKLLEILFRFLR